MMTRHLSNGAMRVKLLLYNRERGCDYPINNKIYMDL